MDQQTPQEIIDTTESPFLTFMMKIYQAIDMPSGTVLNINTMSLLIAFIIQFATGGKFKVPAEWLGFYGTILAFFGAHNTVKWVKERDAKMKEKIAELNSINPNTQLKNNISSAIQNVEQVQNQVLGK